jgi:competence protein ComEA
MQGLLRALGTVLLIVSVGWALAAGKVNINTADAKTLAKELEGIGPSKAEAIVEYRKAHGPFKSVDALANVKGIGEAAIKSNRERMTVGE